MLFEDHYKRDKLINKYSDVIVKQGRDTRRFLTLFIFANILDHSLNIILFS